MAYYGTTAAKEDTVDSAVMTQRQAETGKQGADARYATTQTAVESFAIVGVGTVVTVVVYIALLALIVMRLLTTSRTTPGA